jgi:tetratricopeptide (TPR) repeat protein
VSEADQATALDLYAAGNRDFIESRFAEALAKYKEAIKYWDHPAIRFNMAVCLINLDQPFEAMDNLTRSLAFGEAALGADANAQGLIYRKLLDAQLTHVKIASREPGTQITLDGKFLFTAPGDANEILLPGEHQVIASRIGYLTASKTLILVPGGRTAYDVPPLEIKVATRIVRHWTPWVPWVVLASGAALASAGAASYIAASHNFTSYDSGITERCPAGCGPVMLASFADLRRQKERGETEQVLAFSLISAGAAAVIAGGIGLIVNQPRVQVENDHVRAVVTPMPGGATLAVRWGF